MKKYYYHPESNSYFETQCQKEIEDAFEYGCQEISEQQYTIKSTIHSMIAKYGEDSQIDVAIEEMSELTKELIKYKRSKIHFRERAAASREHVVEELGDVMFMMEYLKSIFGISEDEIKNIVQSKAQRTKERYIYGEK